VTNEAHSGGETTGPRNAADTQSRCLAAIPRASTLIGKEHHGARSIRPATETPMLSLQRTGISRQWRGKMLCPRLCIRFSVVGHGTKSSRGIFYHHVGSSIITWDRLSSRGIFYNHVGSSIITWDRLSSRGIAYHHVHHHVGSSIIT